MDKISLLFFVLLLGMCANFGSAQKVEYKQSEEHSDSRVPEFTTTPDTFRVKVEETILLPCAVDHLGSYVLLWNKGHDVISAGTMMISRDKRYKLVNGFNLQLADVRPEDEGEYVCKISKLGAPRQQVHTLEVLVPPTVKSIPADGNLVVRKGKTVPLECKASGNPVPTITWRRKNNILPSGETYVEGFSITIENADRYQAGIYQCTADNGVGTPETAEINLQVLHAPEVEVERSWVHSGTGYEAELVCIVHAEPPPNVRWYRDTLLLDITERRFIEQRGSRYTLILRDVQPADFGNYSCVVDNTLGRARKYIEISGEPKPAVFRSEPVSFHRDSYNITWSVESYSPVEEFRLEYRKFSNNDSEDIYNDWNNVIIPADKSANSTHMKWYNIRSLQPSAIYEALVQARNKFGWNKKSEKFQFYTRGSEFPPFEPTAEPDVFSEPEIQDLGMHSTVPALRGSSTLFFISSLACIGHYFSMEKRC